MAALDDFNIFGEDDQVPAAANAPEIQVVQQGQQANGAPPRLNWTPLMSAFILKKFSDLVAEGVRTDKGFKDCHTNAVAKHLQEFMGQPVSGSQVYNHLRKWRTKWAKICRLKDLSAANWDEDLCMICLDPEHYHNHVKVHS